VDASQAELEEDEAVSGTGEGDEVMEEAEEQEGYSTFYITCSRHISRFPS
jgi:casein kinase II subunit beta